MTEPHPQHTAPQPISHAASLGKPAACIAHDLLDSWQVPGYGPLRGFCEFRLPEGCDDLVSQMDAYVAASVRRAPGAIGLANNLRASIARQAEAINRYATDLELPFQLDGTSISDGLLETIDQRLEPHISPA